MNQSHRLPLLDIEGKVATITLNNPHVANRLGVADLNEIQRHLSVVNQSRSVLVLRFFATGNYFCSGFDLKAFGADHSPSSLLFGETVDLIEHARPITIASIQGGIYGGGTDLCLACDFRVGTQNINMFVPAAKLGLHFYPGGLKRYVKRLGVDKAKEIFLLANEFTAHELYAMGYLTHLVESENLTPLVDTITRNLSAKAPLALSSVKKHLNLIADNNFDPDAIIELVKKSEQSADIQEGIAAWKEKREPIFKGH